MGANGGAGARICLLAAAVAAAGALAVAALRGGADGGSAPDRDGGGAAGSSPGRTALEAPPGPRTESAPTPASPRAAAPEAPPETDFLITARDATTGERVLDFWVERGGVQDLAGELAPPLSRSDPETGEARASRSSPPAPLRVRARRYSVWRGMEPEPPGRRVVASLARATTIHGVVRDASGAPVVGARVELEFFGEGTAGLASDAEPVEFSGRRMRFTDERGAFELSGLRPGVWRTRVPWLSEFSTSPKQLLAPGNWIVADHWLGARTRIVVDVVGAQASDQPPTRVLVTRIAGPHEAWPGGDPVEDAVVASGYTDETGSVTIGPLPTGSYRVSVQSAAGEASPREIDVATSSPSLVTMEFDLGSTPGD